MVSHFMVVIILVFVDRITNQGPGQCTNPRTNKRAFTGITRLIPYHRP